MTRDRRAYYFLILAVVAAFFLFFRMGSFPSDLDGEVASMGDSVLFLMKANDLGIPSTEYLHEVHDLWPGPLSDYPFFIYPFSSPLAQSFMYWTYRLLGASVFSNHLVSSVFGFLTIVLTYFFARRMYGEKTGFLSALFLSTMLYFVLLVRYGLLYFTLSAFTVLVTMCLFYLAHEKRSRQTLYLAGGAAGIAWFNGWVTPPTVLAILVLAVLLNCNPRSLSSLWKGLPSLKRMWGERANGNLLGMRDYLVMALLILITVHGLSVGYSLFFDAPPSETYRRISELSFGRGELIASLTKDAMGAKICNFQLLFQNMFLGMTPYFGGGISHFNQHLEGYPMVPYFISLSLLAGVVSALKRRSLGDRICIAYLGFPFLMFALFARFQPRYMIVAAPVIAILAARGAVETVDLLIERAKGFCSSENVSRVAWIVLGALVIITMLSTYMAYFGVFAEKDANLIRDYGQSEVARYIMEHGKPKDTIVVLGDRILVSYDQLYFTTNGMPYPALYWWDDLLLKDFGGRSGAVGKLDGWEREVLARKERIFYVFSIGPHYYESPGWNYWEQVDWHEFRDLHPDLRPVKRVYYSSGIPALEVYEVNRTARRDNTIFVEGGSGEIDFTASSSGEVDLIEVRGEVQNLTVALGDEMLVLPMRILPSMEVTVTFDRESRILFEPIFDSEGYRKEIYDQANMTLQTAKDGTFLELDGESGYLTYKLESPFPIERLSVRSNPRVFNDLQRKNAVSAYYSTDGKRYEKIYEVRSDGSGEWSVYRNLCTGGTFNKGVYEKETYHILYPNSRVVYIKFAFDGYPGEAQLWSTKMAGDHSLRFDAQMDSSGLSRPRVKEGENTLGVKSQGGASILLATTIPISYRRTYEGEDLLHFVGRNAPDPGAGNGRARLAEVRKDVQGHMAYGPGTPLGRPGRYRATFRVKAGDNKIPEGVAKLDVVALDKVFGELELKGTDFQRPGEYQDFSIDFTTDGREPMQYRVLYLARADIWIDRVEVSEIRER